MPNNNFNYQNQNNNNQPRQPPSSANNFNNYNAASGLIRPVPWREFYNRQDMMIMNEIMRAANLFNPNNNETSMNQQQQQQQPWQTETSSASATAHQPTAPVPPGFVPMMVRPQMFPAHSAMHAINFGGAGDTAPFYGAEPPPGSMLLQNMLLVPVGQTAPMLESDLRRAQELYPPMDLEHEPQAHNTTGAHEAPPMNAWPQGRAPRQHEFFERSRDIIRTLEGSWSPVFGTYMNVPVNQITTNQVGATTTYVVSSHASQEPYVEAGNANNEPLAESMEPLCKCDSDVCGDELGNFFKKKNVNNQFKDKNGPKPVEPPAFELKTVLTYSQVVRNLAITHPMSSAAPPKDQDPLNMPCYNAEDRKDEPIKIDGSIELTTCADPQDDELCPVGNSTTPELEEVLVVAKGDAQQQHEVQEQDQEDQHENKETPLAEERNHEKEQPRVETEQQEKKRLQKEQKQKEQDEMERQQEEQAQKERHHVESLHKKLLYNQKHQQKKEEQILKEQQRIDRLQKKLAFKAQKQKEILRKEEQQKEQKLKDQQQRQETKRGQRKKDKQAKKVQVQIQKQQKSQQQQQQPAVQAKSQKSRSAQQNKRSNNATETLVSGKTTSKTPVNVGGKYATATSSVALSSTKPSCAVTCMQDAQIVKSLLSVEDIQTKQGLNQNQIGAVLPEKDSTFGISSSPSAQLEMQPNEASSIIEQQPIDNKNAKDLENIEAVEQSSSISAVEQSSSISAVEQTASVPAVEQTSSVPVVEQSSSVQTMEQSPSNEINQKSSSTSSVEQSSNETAIKNQGNNTKHGKKRRCRRRRQRKPNSNRKREEQQPCENNNFERGSFLETFWTVLKFGFQLVLALLIILFYTIRNYFKSR